MQLFRTLSEVQTEGPTVITIGNYDGVHRGHQALLKTLKAKAQLQTPAATTALVTFDPHPLTVLRPDIELSLLTTPLERMQLASRLGVELGIILPFTYELANLTAQEFMARLNERLNVCALVVGPDFALGKNRSGTLDRLAELGRDLGYELVVQGHVALEGLSVRSNLIRNLLKEGDVQQAAALLGRPYHMCGIVVHGNKQGREIGIPTANVEIAKAKLWPENGVYATRTWVMHDNAPVPYRSVTNLGTRPTVDGTDRRLETHLLHYSDGADGGEVREDLYGIKLYVEFIERLRGEIRFSSLDNLMEQIHRDIATAELIFDRNSMNNAPFFTTTLHSLQ